MIIDWAPNPVVFELGPLRPRWYGVCFLIGFAFGQYFVGRIFQSMGHKKEESAILTNYLIAGTAIGARLVHCLFYEPSYYFAHPIEILFIWKGGLASHGGYLGVVLASYLFYQKRKDWLTPLQLLDIISFSSLFTGVLIRLGNFMNSEIVGKPTDGSWGIVFSKLDNIPRHPAQLYESLGYFVCSMVTLFVFRKKNDSWPHGRVFGVALGLSFLFRFFVEYFKEEQANFEMPLSLNMGQWLSIPMVLVGAYYFFRRPHKS